MNYSTLEDAYGSSFKQRAPITQPGVKNLYEEPVAKPEFTSLAKKSDESIRKNQALVNSLEGSLPLDDDPSTQTFVPTPPQIRRREHFTQSQPAGFHESQEQADKLSRILRLIEQNRTGYERPAVQDMALYVFTGVFFLFTFDTFVELGKSMR